MSRLTSVDDHYTPEPEEDAERYGGGGNGGSGMGHRMTALENRMGAVENRLTAVEARMEHLATKEDLEKAKNSIWLAISMIVGIAVAIIKLL